MELRVNKIFYLVLLFLVLFSLILLLFAHIFNVSDKSHSRTEIIEHETCAILK